MRQKSQRGEGLGFCHVVIQSFSSKYYSNRAYTDHGHHFYLFWENSRVVAVKQVTCRWTHTHSPVDHAAFAEFFCSTFSPPDPGLLPVPRPPDVEKNPHQHWLLTGGYRFMFMLMVNIQIILCFFFSLLHQSLHRLFSCPCQPVGPALSAG